MTEASLRLVASSQNLSAIVEASSVALPPSKAVPFGHPQHHHFADVDAFGRELLRQEPHGLVLRRFADGQPQHSYRDRRGSGTGEASRYDGSLQSAVAVGAVRAAGPVTRVAT